MHQKWPGQTLRASTTCVQRICEKKWLPLGCWMATNCCNHFRAVKHDTSICNFKPLQAFHDCSTTSGTSWNIENIFFDQFPKTSLQMWVFVGGFWPFLIRYHHLPYVPRRCPVRAVWLWETSGRFVQEMLVGICFKVCWDSVYSFVKYRFV